jgi:DNA gyrase subunit A
MVATIQVLDDDQVMLMTDTGRLMRMKMNGVSIIGRNTQGVTLIKCDKNERVIGAVRVVEKQDDDADSDTSEPKLFESGDDA